MNECGNRTLVIGWGNELRSDDGAGRVASRALAGLGLPSVKVLDVHQLTPELAEYIKDADRVFFIDACPAAECTGVYLRALQDRRDDAWVRPSASGHAGSPRELLRFTEELFGARPEAWLVAVPAHSFDIGEGLTPETRRAVEQAVEQVQILMQHTEGASHECA